MTFAYLRTSVWRKNKVSLEMQLEAIKKKAEELGVPLPKENEVFQDKGVSGAIEERMGLQALLAELSKPSMMGQTLVVYRVDRLSRDTGIMMRILDVLENNDIKLISAMEPLPTSENPAMRKMMIHVHSLVAQFERDVIIENIKLGLTQKRSEGKPLSVNAPFGYRYSKEMLAPIDEELKIVRHIFDLYLTGEFGYKRIVKCLADENYLFRNRPFQENDIYRILRNKTYYGVLKGGGVGGEYQGTHETVITAEEYIAVKKIRNRRRSDKIHTRENWLRKKIACPLCGQNLTPRIKRWRRKSYHYYCCANPRCTERMIKADEVERKVKKSVITFLVKSPVLDRMSDEIKSRQKMEHSRAKRNVLQAKKDKERLFLQFEEGSISHDEFSKALSALKQGETEQPQSPKAEIQIGYLEELLQQRTQSQKKGLPDEFYFKMVERVCIDTEYQVKEIYLKHLQFNILKQEEITL